MKTIPVENIPVLDCDIAIENRRKRTANPQRDLKYHFFSFFRALETFLFHGETENRIYNRFNCSSQLFTVV